ncbi:DUF418 domain-containing protein [Nesterenkonia halobia]|uniref:DUF418 domain-containing protein n=1 Tax=Nesterenkonia halobia TaxID=37922 RepID=A0ABP6REN1_9MICC
MAVARRPAGPAEPADDGGRRSRRRTDRTGGPARAGRPASRPRAGGRLHGLDVARSLAIVGMVAVNVGPRGAEGLLGTLHDLPLGRASLLFMLLAGIGMSLMTRTVRRPRRAPLPWATILWRAALLLVGGLALQLAAHEASVILPVYGILFLASLPLLRAPAWLLGALAAALLALGPLLWLALRSGADAFAVAEPTLLDPPDEILRGILVTGSYPLVVWAAPFVAGLLLGRLDLRSPTLQRQLVLWGAVTAVAAYSLSRLLILLLGEPDRSVGVHRLISATAHSQMPLWLISSTGAALFVLGLCLMGESFAARRLSALVAAGRLSLTLYVGHLVALALVVRPGPDSLAGGILTTVVICLVSVAFAWLWTRRFSAGPLERLLRLPRRGARRAAS